MAGFNHKQAAVDRGARMLRTALGPAISTLLQDPSVIEVMLNSDGRIWIDRLSEGLADTCEILSAADGERKRVERIWRREGLKVPQKQARKGRLWLNDGSCVRLRPERPNHVWSCDFVQDRTRDGRIFRTLNIIDEFTKEALVIRVKRKLNSTDIVDALTDLFILRGPPEFIRSDNGAEFIAKKVQAWIGAVGAKTAFIAPGSPWENGYCESFNARFRDEMLNGEVFHTLHKAQILIERWRRHYNTVRPHSALNYRPPAPETFVQMDHRPTMH